MRVYKLMAAVASLALIGAGCAEDGKDGAVGPAGEKGDKGDQGDKGDTGDQGPAGDKGDKGDQGEAGEDAPCAANALLEIDGVTGVASPVFPGEEAEFTIDFAGGGEDITVQFIGTAELLDGMATVPPAPKAGADAATFTVTPEAEGEYHYVVVATDGCSVATTTFTLKVRSALVSIVHLFPGADDVGFMIRGTDIPLYQMVNGLFGPEPVFTIGQGGSFPGYFRVPMSSLELDMYPDADADGTPDLDATPIAVPTLNLEPNDRVVVAAYADASGNLAWAVLKPDQSMVEGDANARFQFAHLAGGVGPVDISNQENMSVVLVNDAALGTLSSGLLLPPLDYTVWVDANNDASPEFEVELPMATNQVLPGDYVLIFAWLDGAGDLQIFIHDTGGDGTQYEGMIFPFTGTATRYLGPPDETFALAAPVSTIDASTDVVMAIEADAGCVVEFLTIDYDITTEGDTWGTDVNFTLVSPDGTEIDLGNGSLSDAGTEEGTLDGSNAFAGKGVNGTWTLTVTDEYEDESGVTVNALSLNIYCAAP